MRYFALMRKEPDSDFSVDFPDFPGCVTAGSTLEEARSLAAEVLAFHIDGMIEDGLSVPAASDLEAITAQPDSADALPFLVDVADRRPKVVRVNVTMPESDLKAMDAFAKRQGKSRSALLTEAVRHLLAEASKHHAA